MSKIIFWMISGWQQDEISNVAVNLFAFVYIPCRFAAGDSSRLFFESQLI